MVNKGTKSVKDDIILDWRSYIDCENGEFVYLAEELLKIDICRKGLVNRKSYSNEVAERVIVIAMKLPKRISKSRRKVFGIAEKW